MVFQILKTGQKNKLFREHRAQKDKLVLKIQSNKFMILKMEQKTKDSGREAKEQTMKSYWRWNKRTNYEVIQKMEQKNKHVTTEDRTTEIADTKNRAKGINMMGKGGGGGAVYSAHTFLFSTLFLSLNMQQNNKNKQQGNIHIWWTMGTNVYSHVQFSAVTYRGGLPSEVADAHVWAYHNFHVYTPARLKHRTQLIQSLIKHL